MEGAGVVRSIAADVTTCQPGDRVAYCMERGSYAEFAAVDAWKLLPLPDEVMTTEAVQIVLQGLTAHYLTRSTFALKQGDTCLVHAAAGGTGSLIVQMAKVAGARVIGTVSSAKKAAQAEAAGCDHIINYKREDFAAEVKKLTGGRGVDVVYDGVGKTTFAGSLDSLRPRGTLALFGQASGPVPKFDPQILNQKGSLFLTRPSLGHYAANRDELLWRSGELFEWLRTGAVRVLSALSYPLADAAQAHEDLEKRKSIGKLVLRVR
jgi:NADPH2:quinone reductase